MNWENSKSDKRASDRKFQEDREKNIELDFKKKRNEKLIERNEELEKQIKDSKK